MQDEIKNRFDIERVDDLPITPEGLREYADVMRESCYTPGDSIGHLGYMWEDKPHRIVSQMKDRLYKAADEIAALRADLAQARAQIEALRNAGVKALNYIENTEGELGITLDSGNDLRAALKEPSHDH